MWNIGCTRPHGRSHGGGGAGTGRQECPAGEFHDPATCTMQRAAWRTQDLFPHFAAFVGGEMVKAEIVKVEMCRLKTAKERSQPQ